MNDSFIRIICETDNCFTNYRTQNSIFIHFPNNSKSLIRNVFGSNFSYYRTEVCEKGKLYLSITVSWFFALGQQFW